MKAKCFRMVELLRERMLCFALGNDYLDSYCSNCLIHTSKVDLKKCTSCKQVHYCSGECQKADWPMHKQECKSIQTHRIVLDDGTRLVLRLARLYKMEMEQPRNPDENIRRIEDLMDHWDDEGENGVRIRERAKEWAIENGRYEVIQLHGFETMTRLFAKSYTNSFGLKSEEGRSIGIALCLQLSKIDHSCKPVTRVVCRRNDVTMLPTGFPGDGLNIATAFHSYIDELQTRHERRKQLKEQYNFDCKCSRCLSDEETQAMESFRCLECLEGEIPKLGGTCKSCGEKMGKEHSRSCITTLQCITEAPARLRCKEVSKDQRRELAQSVYGLCEDFLSKYHVGRLSILRFLFDIEWNDGRYAKATQYCRDTLLIHEKHQGPMDVAVLYMKWSLAKVLFASGEYEEAQKMSNGLKGIFKAIYGPESIVVKQIEALASGEYEYEQMVQQVAGVQLKEKIVKEDKKEVKEKSEAEKQVY